MNGTKSLVGQRELTEKQRALVDTLVSKDYTIKEAAQIAGYSSGCDGESGRVAASKTLRLPNVQEYMRKQMMSAFGLAAPRAFRRMVHLMDMADSEHVQLDASKQVLDRAGYVADREGILKQSIGKVEVIIDLS